MENERKKLRKPNTVQYHNMLMAINRTERKVMNSAKAEWKT